VPVLRTHGTGFDVPITVVTIDVAFQSHLPGIVLEQLDPEIFEFLFHMSRFEVTFSDP
jgi:hypothetical protein